MIKFIGQKSLNKIGQKYKELKTLVNKKADSGDVKSLSQAFDGMRNMINLKTVEWDNKVDKDGGKVLSNNNYTNEDKAKVNAIPENPKYTDTVISVVDNLTTDDGTKALSAKQGKVLQDNKADKSNISRCKAKGYNTSNVWQDLGTERDLEDWIGDFDKRTREFKDVKRYELSDKITAWKCGRVVSVFFNGIFTNDVLEITVPSDIIPISERASFLINERSLINYRDTKFSVSATSNEFLGYPIITYISRI